ncbi:hypothetical protein NPIL_586741 [Nephila pilipes]|uniref:Uncharacterized protein n=1 Tax=Nephila pilipes TaxID=299642 RepID=A0A8X6QKB6_NEPPI|nr:hypothetical protein NPIL_586741 [Nephila pilipes]
MVENIGFEVVLCQSEIKINRLPSHEKAKDLFYSFCPLVPHVPENQREIFKEELYQCLLEKFARNDDRTPVHMASVLEIVIRKPE